MSDELDDAIEAAAQKPKSATTDAGSVTMPSIPEQIAAAEHGDAQRASRGRRRGLLFQKLKPPGTI